MPRPPLPSYSTPENTTFHPVFKRAIEETLISRGLTSSIKIEGQFPSPTGPIDFALIDRTTNKVILPVEIKRTPSGVRGLGRRQARDYWSNLGSQCQTPFYCSTNLEIIELFRYDASRPRTSAQRLKLTNSSAGSLAITSENNFYSALINCLDEVLNVVLGSTSFNYAAGLSQFQQHIEAAVNNQAKWHQIFIPTCFEYIRGASSSIPNLGSKTGGWRSADFYHSTPSRISQLGRMVDFEHIFCEPSPTASDPTAFLPPVLLEAYESGKMLGNGDDIAEIVNEALAPSGLGIVETDTELAQLMGIVAKVALGRELNPHEEIMDPGSGSGRLITALPITAFPTLRPKQILAIEKEEQFSEPLSLRLGLAFANLISPTNAPTIKISGIEYVDKTILNNVALVVMNPPFLSGVHAAATKGVFANRIREISGSTSMLNDGQIALEALFLELVWNLVNDGTVIATIFPIQHLHRLSSEVTNLRIFLAKKFSLSHIVLYPSKGLFEGVTKQTVLLIGKKNCSASHIDFIEVQKQVGNIDFAQLYNGLIAGNSSPTHGVSVYPISRSDLLSSAPDGWKKVIGIGARVESFIQSHFSHYAVLGTLPSTQIRRGTVGNGGNTKLTVFNSSSPRFSNVVNLIPHAWIRPVLNTTESMPRVLTPASAPQTSFMPPQCAYQPGTPENIILMSIVNAYLAIPQLSSGSQPRHTHTRDDVIRKLKADQKDFGAGWVLIQRASRTKGEISILEHTGVLLSTNVPMVKLGTLKERQLLASWLLSIFGQLQFELYSTPQEGMRKLEMGGIKKIAYPDFSSIPQSIESQLIANVATEASCDFSNLVERPSDKLWASIVNPADSANCLSQALGLLQEIIDERKGFGNAN